MDFNKLLNVSAQLGKMLLESGAEIYRVEESIQRMGLAYGAKYVDVYADEGITGTNRKRREAFNRMIKDND